MLMVAMWIAVLVGVVMTGLFVWGFRLRGVWGLGFSFFFVVFLMSWAAGIWVRPLGEAAPDNAPWLIEFLVGFVVALLMSSSVPSWGRVRSAPAVQVERRSAPVLRLTPAYWVAVLVLVFAIVVI